MVNFPVLYTYIYIYVIPSLWAGKIQLRVIAMFVLILCIFLCNVYRSDPLKLSFNCISPQPQTTVQCMAGNIHPWLNYTNK